MTDQQMLPFGMAATNLTDTYRRTLNPAEPCPHCGQPRGRNTWGHTIHHSNLLIRCELSHPRTTTTL